MLYIVCGLVAVGIFICILAFMKPESILGNLLKPFSERFQKNLERSLVESQMKLAKSREEMEKAREGANKAQLKAEEAEQKFLLSQTPEYRENKKLKKLRDLEEENKQLELRIAELKKHGGAA